MSDRSSKSDIVRSKADVAKGKVRARNKRSVLWMLAFLAVVVAFALGFLFRGNANLMSAIGINVASDDGSVAAGTTASQKTYDSLSERINEAEEILSTYSFDEINLDETTNTMLTDLIESTGDPGYL